MAQSRTVAVIGTGRMGAAMAHTLSRVGFRLVAWNRSRDSAANGAAGTGATVADSAATAVAGAEFVVSSLADDEAVMDVYLGPDGIVEGARPRTIVMDTSTVDSTTVIRVGQGVDAVGASFLDCPISGSVSTVEAGALTIMVGGDPRLIESASPVLDVLAASSNCGHR